MMMIAIFVACIVSTGANAFNLHTLSPIRLFHHHESITQLLSVSDGNTNIEQKMLSRRSALSSFVAAGIAASSIDTVIGAPAEAQVEGSRTIGQISGSGLVFKDTLVVESFDDPKVKGVTLYVSNFERPLTGKYAPFVPSKTIAVCICKTDPF